jgi:hypothetical protein
MNNSYNQLISKLDGFIRKFYRNELLKGLIWFVALALVLYLSVIGLEAVGKFGSTTRSLMFYGFVGGFGFLLVRYILTPVFKLYKIGKTIDHHQAAQILGKHFPDVGDKLINTLQLKKDAEGTNNDLLLASIDKRVGTLSPVPFNSAVDYRENRRYAKFVLVPLSVLVILLFVNAKWVTDPTGRIVNYDNEYTPPAPYEIILENNDLSVVEQEEVVLKVRINGKEVPPSISVIKNGNKYRMKKVSNREYAYKMRADGDTKLKFTSGEIDSRNYTLKVLPRPSIEEFTLELDYPDYTGIRDQKLKSIGDVNIPEGTIVKWTFNTKNVSRVYMSSQLIDTALKVDVMDETSVSRQLFNSEQYVVTTENPYLSKADSAVYFVEVSKDEYPSISVTEDKDTANERLRYFSGKVSDDYGIRNLSMSINYRKGERKGQNKSFPVRVSEGVLSEDFMHYINFDQLALMPGEEVSYFFTVWDNDGINGSKSSSSGARIFAMPSQKEMEAAYSESAENTMSEMQKAMKDAAELKKQMKQLQNELSNSQNMSWQQKQKLESMMQKQMSLQQKVDELKKEFKKNNEDQEKYKELSEEEKEEREKLEELMEELFTPEMKEMLKELQELMKELNKDKIQQNLEEMNLENENLEKTLEQALEHMKQLQFQEKLKDLVEDAKELAEKQKDLAEKMENKEIDKEEAKAAQKEIDEEMKDVEEKMEELQEKNDDLGKKHDMDKPEEEQKASEDAQKESQEQMQNNKMKKASESQKEAGEQMQKMSESLASMQAQAQQQQQQEDMDALRQLLENLIEMSFSQEEIMDDIKSLAAHDPKYVEVGRKQRKIKDDAQIIKDSLFALSKRVIEIKPLINEEIGQINYYMDKSLEDIGERRTNEARSKQQFIMKSTNNLALLLDEVLKQMQQQMQAQSQSSGSGSCMKPGSGKSKPTSIPSLQQMQEQLGKQMEKMKKGMKDGKGEEGKGKKPGEKGGPGGEKPNGQGAGGSQSGDGKEEGQGQEQSESLSKLAAQQSAIREQLKKLREQLNQDGSGNGNGLNKIIDDMEKTEEDIIYNKIGDQTFKRQKDILTRLLEHEKAERERDWDEKRESKEAKNEEFSNPDRFLEYKKKKEKEIELLRTIPPDLKKYYRKKVNAYFNSAE